MGGRRLDLQKPTNPGQKKKSFFFLSRPRIVNAFSNIPFLDSCQGTQTGLRTALDGRTDRVSRFRTTECLSGVPCPVWAPLHETRNRMFENACTIWGLLRKLNFYFFCPGYGRFLRSKLFRTNFSDQEKKNDHFPTFHEKKKFLKNRFLSMIPAP